MLGNSIPKIHLKLVKHTAVSQRHEIHSFVPKQFCCELPQAQLSPPEDWHWQRLGQAPAWKLSLTQGHNSQPTCPPAHRAHPHLAPTQTAPGGHLPDRRTAESSLDSCLLKPVIKDVLVLPALESKVPHDCILHLVKAIQLD